VKISLAARQSPFAASRILKRIDGRHDGPAQGKIASRLQQVAGHVTAANHAGCAFMPSFLALFAAFFSFMDIAGFFLASFFALRSFDMAFTPVR